jgi:release factor glutamine methyltransferase
MPEPAFSLGPMLAEGAAALGAAGLPEPAREARRIWTGLAPGAERLLDGARRPVSAVEGQAFERAVARRAVGEPLAYVTGWAGFRHLTLRADRRALIPRPETEGLVDLALARVRCGRVADIGTGTGCLALSLQQEGDFDAVVGVDRSVEALALARENAALTGLAPVLVQGDLTLPLASAAFDLVVSNPPYLTDGEYAVLDGSVRSWEPRLALPSGADGMEATRRLLDDGRRVLRPGGWLVLEIDCARAVAAAECARLMGWTDVAVHMDLFGRERHLLARRSDTP